MIFDTHAHYYDEAFDADRDAPLASLPRPGGWPWWSARLRSESSRQSIALAERYGFLYAAAGYHPEIWRGRPSPIWTPSRPVRPPEGGGGGGDRPGLLLAQDAGGAGQLPGLLRRPALPGGGAQPPAIVHDRDAHRDCLDIVRAHPGVRGCSTAIPAAWRTPRCWWTRAGCSPSPATSPSRTPAGPPDILRWLPWTG